MEMTVEKAMLCKTAVMKVNFGSLKKGEVVAVRFTLWNTLTEEHFFACTKGDRKEIVGHRSLESFVL